MTPEQQAQMLAEWLEGHPGAEPPAGLEPDVVEAVYALRPDLAPAPRVSLDDILGAVTSGPLAHGAQAPEVDDDEASGAAVVPFPGPTVEAKTPARWGRWAFGAGTGTVLAMAAVALLVVRVVGVESSPDLGMSAKLEAQPVAATAPPAKEKDLPPGATPDDLFDEVEVADLGEDDFVDDFARDVGGEFRSVQGVAGGTGTGEAGWADGTVTADAAPLAVAHEPPPPRPQPKPTPGPVPSPAPMVAARPALGPVTTRPTAAPPPPPEAVATTPARQPAVTLDVARDDPAVAELDEDLASGVLVPERSASYDDLVVLEAAPAAGYAGREARTEDAGDRTSVDRPERPLEERARLDTKPNADSIEIAQSRTPIGRPGRRGQDAPDAMSQAEADPDLAAGSTTTGEAEATAAAVGGVVAERKVTEASSGLDALRARAIPPDLPQSELLARSVTPANDDARLYVADGRYVEAGNALLPTLTLPAPQGSTNAAQAATWFLQGDDPALARTAAEAGLTNASGNTPERSWLYVLYGDALRESGDSAGATRAYAEAIALNDDRRGAPASEPVEASEPGR